MTARLVVSGLEVSAGGRRLVGPIDLALEAGRPLVLLGETGAGKSLIAQAILGMPQAGLEMRGRIALDGARIDSLPPRERARLWGRRIALLPQEPWRALDPIMAALDQVEETHALVARRPPAEARAAAEADFAALGLAGAEDRLPGRLSGGMAQRVAFAAARAGGAPVLLADEPTKGLDAARRDGVARLLAGAAAGGAALLVITHDVAVARALGGDAIVLRAGEAVERGPTAELFAAPRHPYARALIEADPARWPPRPAPSLSGSALRAEGIVVAREGRPLAGPLDLDLRRGERLSVTGPSGAGKSSLLDVLAGLLPPAAGRVARGDGVGPLGVQKLYQDPPAAFPPRVALGTALDDLARRHGFARARIDDLLARMRVAPDLLARRPDAVSGGELQRTALARLLALAPAVILADEPASRLDPVTRREVMDLIDDETRVTGAAVILVTHDPDVAINWSPRSLRLGDLGPKEGASGAGRPRGAPVMTTGGVGS